MNILILGAGPAGLIAAHAASSHPLVKNVRILSRQGRKSRMNGAQYLHQPIPGVPAAQFSIKYELVGEVANYRSKVYGPTWDGVVSPEDFIGTHDAWDIRDTYDWLWETYELSGFVQDYDVTPAALRQTLSSLRPDACISTVPAPLLCADGHAFGSTEIWSTNKAVGRIEQNHVICNGLAENAWYRMSRINGYQNTEWPANLRPPITPMWSVIKPTKNNCTCFPEIVRTGRYGKWEKGVLSHDAWADTVNAIDKVASAA